MTLKQLEKLYPEPNLRPGGFNWSLDEIGIQLFWTGNDAIALNWLLSESFKIDDRGLISLTGLAAANLDLEARIGLYQGIKTSFLQHGSCIKHAGKTSQTISIDEKDLEISYQKVASYIYQTFSKLSDRNGKLVTETIGIKSWLYPGAIVRHNLIEKQTIF
jgi:CRISPR-associated protein Cas8a1/Csx13